MKLQCHQMIIWGAIMVTKPLIQAYFTLSVILMDIMNKQKQSINKNINLNL